MSILRNPPKLTYNGLTIILAQPSRNDVKQLLTGYAGDFFNKECLSPETNEYCTDVRLAVDKSPLLEGTKVVMLLGDRALVEYIHAGMTLDEARGNPVVKNGIVYIPSFTPQDAIDPKDYESTHNEYLNGEHEDPFFKELALGEVFESKGRGRTARSNYRFWLKADTKKALRILKNGGVLPKLYEKEPNYYIDSGLKELCDRLSDTKNQHMFFDMETDFISYDMRCFAFSFDNEPHSVFAVPTLTTDYRPRYGAEQHKLYRALTNAIRNNVLVAHNGSQFDFFVLAWLYKIPIDKVYDTLISQHRCFLQVEKSLGHCVSYYTYEPYHKNEGAHGFFNQDQVEKLLSYCGKDVFTMWLVWKGQQKLMAMDPGLKASIEQGNAAIKPYLTTSLLGMRYDEELRKKWIADNDMVMGKLMGVLQTLTGPKVEPLISNQKCTRYFNDMMAYPVVKRTPTGSSSLAADALYKLALKVNTPVIKFLIKYRETQKQTGTLKFTPWIK